MQRGPARGKQAQQNDKKQEVSDADIQKEIKETLARLSGGGKSKSSKLRRAKRDMVAARHEEEEIRRQEELDRFETHGVCNGFRTYPHDECRGE